MNSNKCHKQFTLIKESNTTSGVRQLKLRKWKVKETREDSYEARNGEEFSIWLATDAGLPDC